MTISIGVPISSKELREGGGDVIRKWKQDRQRNRQEQANHGEDKRASTSEIRRHEKWVPRASQPVRIAELESSPLIGMFDSHPRLVSNLRSITRLAIHGETKV
jgi:hypothetical protein